MDNRPNPGRALQDADGQRTRGKLRVFLGYAAGVGKTYAMLEAARRRLVRDDDVVIACVETHGQPEMEALLESMEIVRRRSTVHRGISVDEMDLDAVLAREPDLAVVDGLAHSNAPGARHTKRYQDVLELLNAGIDVYTTLNVQHLESLKDIVTQITGVAVAETVPDSLFDDADDIELIDLPVDELLQRLEEGKVRAPEQAPEAMQAFFRPGNLSALRELALRRAAERVDRQMRTYMQAHDIVGPWPARERLLVCVGPSPLSERLVRTAKRLAKRLNAEWTALYVETPADAVLSEAERERLAHTLKLAEELGAKSVTLPGSSVAEAVAVYARTHNVTKIVAGKPLQPRWQELFRGSIVERIVRHSHDVDVYVISGGAQRPRQFWTYPLLRTHAQAWHGFLYSVLLVMLITLLALPLRAVIEPTNLAMFYLLAVIAAAIRLGRGPAIFTSLLSVIAFDLIFVPPYYTFGVADAQYLLTFAALLSVSLVISALTTQAREQARAAQRREAQTAALYELSRELAAAADLEAVAQVVITHVQRIMGGEVAVFVRDEDELSLRSASADFQFDRREVEVANWTYRQVQIAGYGTNTLADAAAVYLPLNAARRVVGVLGVSPAETDEEMTPEQRRLLESFASQAALAIERSLLAEEARRAQLLHEKEKLQTALLNSISHDLRTPLATITGSLSSLRDDHALLDVRARRELLNSAYEEAERLNRLVGNLLDMTRLESGAMRISTELAEIEDVIGAALSQLSNRLRNRQVIIQTPKEAPLVPIDFALIVQVFVNLLDNAHKYAPPDTAIEIRARSSEDELLVEVVDHGPGIPPEQLNRIFDKFVRVEKGDRTSGTGLGLSISKGIVEAHGGRIWAKNSEESGAVLTVGLPLHSYEEQLVEVST